VNYTVAPDGNELIKQKRQLSSKELRQRHLVNQSCGRGAERQVREPPVQPSKL
jgi:hypothetical protein